MMAHSSYQLTKAARNDLAEIARYTKKTWGKAQALKYAQLIDACFEKIASARDVSKNILPNNKFVYVCHCEHHYVFYLKKKISGTPIILAVLHERMDLIERLKARLPS